VTQSNILQHLTLHIKWSTYIKKSRYK